MADVISINIRGIQPGMAELKRVFIFIKRNVDQILDGDSDACFSEAPFVDVRTLTEKVGITETRLVSPEEINYEHARLRGTVILVNKEDSPEEQQFSIAHEIYHFIFTGKEAARSVTNPQLDIWKSHEKMSMKFYPNN